MLHNSQISVKIKEILRIEFLVTKNYAPPK
jgi:hypothetical protein